MNRPTLPGFQSHDECDALTSTVGDGFAQIEPFGRLRQYRRDACVWLGDDKPDRVYLLKAGRVEITALDSAGDQHIIRVVNTGEIFGELCFCAHRGEHLGTIARATTISQIAEASYKDFLQSLRNDAAGTVMILETWCRRVAQLERRTRILACHDARKRLALALIDFCEQRGAAKEPGPDRFVLTVSHAELAGYVAMTRPHTTVLMTRLRSENLISYSRNSPLTVNLARLRRLFT
jgi:CRP/FNR family cyclic AMP-dependent transcriptional regulator